MVRLSRATIGPVIVVVLIAVVGVAGAIGVSHLGYPTVAEYPASAKEAGHTEEVAGSPVPKVVLSEDAVQKIGLQTAAVTAGPASAGPAGAQVTIPYSAVFYEPSGATWAYVAVEPLAFVRQSITVATINASTAILSAGPPVDAKVVTVGSAQLYGLEVGVEEE